jgi:hypothetical protein
MLERIGHVQAATILRNSSFALHEGTNGFADEFCLLYMLAPVETYFEWMERSQDTNTRVQFRQIPR